MTTPGAGDIPAPARTTPADDFVLTAANALGLDIHDPDDVAKMRRALELAAGAGATVTEEAGQRLYNLLAFFDTREGPMGELVRAAREGWERSSPDMAEPDAWCEFDRLWEGRDRHWTPPGFLPGEGCAVKDLAVGDRIKLLGYPGDAGQGVVTSKVGPHGPLGPDQTTDWYTLSVRFDGSPHESTVGPWRASRHVRRLEAAPA